MFSSPLVPGESATTPTSTKLTVEKRGTVEFKWRRRVGVVAVRVAVHWAPWAKRGAEGPAIWGGEEGEARRRVGSLRVMSSLGSRAMLGVNETVRFPESSRTAGERSVKL